MKIPTIPTMNETANETEIWKRELLTPENLLNECERLKNQADRIRAYEQGRHNAFEEMCFMLERCIADLEECEQE